MSSGNSFDICARRARSTVQRTVEIDADRQPLDSIERAPAGRARALGRPIHLIANRVAAHLMDSGQHEHRARGVDAHRAVERVGAHQHLAAAHGGERRMGVEAPGDQREECAGHERRAPAPAGREQRVRRPRRRRTEPCKRAAQEFEQSIEAIRHGEDSS